MHKFAMSCINDYYRFNSKFGKNNALLINEIQRKLIIQRTSLVLIHYKIK